MADQRKVDRPVSDLQWKKLRAYMKLPNEIRRKYVYYQGPVKADPEKPNKKNVGRYYFMWGYAFLCFEDDLKPGMNASGFLKRFAFDQVIPFPKRTESWARMGRPDPNLPPEEDDEFVDDVIEEPKKVVNDRPNTKKQPPTKKQKMDDQLEEEILEETSYEAPKTPDHNV